MFTPRAPLALLAALSALSAGCQSTPTLGGLFQRQPTAVATNKPASYQAQVPLHPGTEIQWQVQTAHAQLGQVNAGRGMIGPDGTVVVGPYGTCKVAGLTLNQATAAFEKHLAVYMKNPSVRLSATVHANETDLAWRPARTQEQSSFARSTPTGTAVESPSESGIQPVTLRPGLGRAEPATPVDTRVVGPGEATFQVTSDDTVSAPEQPKGPVRSFFAKLFAPLPARK